MKVPKNIDWQRIEEFVGFGSPNAPYVFLGMEEGLLSEAVLDKDLRVRSTYKPFMDLYEAQGDLAETKRYFGADPKNQPTWRPMCDLMLRLVDGIAAPTKPERLRYMADRLGRKDGMTLLAELMPYPRKRTDKKRWLYKKYGRYADYESYRRDMLPKRLALLKPLFARPHERRLVVAYGKGDWTDFKTLFEAQWSFSKPFEWTRVGGTAVVLTPHLSRRAFNSPEDLDHFAAIVNQALSAESRDDT